MRVRATATFANPRAHSGTVVWSAVFSGGTNPPPKCATSVNVCGSPPWSTTFTVVPCLIVRASGSKSQPGSGVPAWALENRSVNTVNAPSVTFLQKSAPSAALNVVGSHSSNATTCTVAGVGASSSCAAPANTRPAATNPTFIKVNLDIIPPLFFHHFGGTWRQSGADTVHSARRERNRQWRAPEIWLKSSCSLNSQRNKALAATAEV